MLNAAAVVVAAAPFVAVVVPTAHVVDVAFVVGGGVGVDLVNVGVDLRWW